jgi:hypothetical protein
MVFIHPVILPDRSSGLSVSRDRYEKMRQRQIEFRDKVDRFILSTEFPELREWRQDATAKEGDEVKRLTPEQSTPDG